MPPKILGFAAILFAIWNLVVFALFGIDKFKAKRGAWRIPERTLLLSSFLLGGLGGFAGMKIFHHKTRHQKFRILLPIFLILTILAAGLAVFFTFR